ncbi:NADP-dependent oxidoreductase [Nocardia crassostreae]|uniref:NADP-dependent oxidoreductase n=1 Tax=Nocardia crassostreae TaxID=53428 RepID=UPI00082EBA20|nr:NADP-dependent oxidoreductase [Nocardia crassostreae]
MRAIAFGDFGVAPALTELPVPEPGPGEVLVRIEHSSINGFDLGVLGGYLKGVYEYEFPVVPGKDFAGTVAVLGAGVTGFAVGDAVFGVIMRPTLGQGGWSEYVSVPAAYGVGALAIQLAAARGATVIATARPGAETEFVTGLGATEVVDHTAALSDQVRARAPEGVHAALHLAGDGAAVAELVRPGGRFASTLHFAPTDSGRDVKATTIMADPSAETLNRLAAALVDGELRLPVARTYALSDAPAAVADFAAGTLGKLAVAIA